MKTDNDLNRRFITYMANLIYYNSINYDKKRRMKDSRFQLTLDTDEKIDSALLAVFDSESVPPNPKDHIADHSLYQAYESLSAQQQQILSFAYVLGLNDKEIARILGVSQQNVSKHCLKTLNKLSNLITEGMSYDGG
ncbi:sigma-70 family RNA polymerase sigma factor [Paenibacillus xylanexedens]|uniref:sigma-70 family RNA polymerase sigma factor n=1 Tax=Paenibacillus xylanexedens TaxID=528191 RepID=UPI0011A604D3|nr:sigma-70 family RNA polymerase sigma factor [Paenibacillus xylanexedens]